MKRKLPRPITIMYRRPPKSTQKFPGILRKATASTLIIQSQLYLNNPHKVAGTIIADTGYWAIWFIFLNKWFDIGKVYDRSKRWLGYYCDIVKPVTRLRTGPRTTVITDLFLDVWIRPDKTYYVLDEDEFANALHNSIISRNVARQARAQLRSLTNKIDHNMFPPKQVTEIQLL